MNRTEAPQPPVQLLGTAWRSYRECVLPVATSPAELKVCRRAFMSGAHAALLLLQSTAVMTPADREAMNAAITTELATYLATVGSTLEGKV